MCETCTEMEAQPVFARFLQASEQYLTSSQFLAQLFRHTMGFWQTTQVLLGKEDLFPLNDPL